MASTAVVHPNSLFLQNREIVLEENHGKSLVSCDVEETESTVVDPLAGLDCTEVLRGKQLAFGC